MKIIGYYNQHGYDICDENGKNLYWAANHALDSKQDGTETEFQLALAVIKDFCEQTAKEIAKEKGAEFIGVEYVER